MKYLLYYHKRGRPESTYALRVVGWVKPKTYSHVRGGWVGRSQSVRTGGNQFEKWEVNACFPHFVKIRCLNGQHFSRDIKKPSYVRTEVGGWVKPKA